MDNDRRGKTKEKTINSIERRNKKVRRKRMDTGSAGQ